LRSIQNAIRAFDRIGEPAGEQVASLLSSIRDLSGARPPGPVLSEVENLQARSRTLEVIETTMRMSRSWPDGLSLSEAIAQGLDERDRAIAKLERERERLRKLLRDKAEGDPTNYAAKEAVVLADPDAAHAAVINDLRRELARANEANRELVQAAVDNETLIQGMKADLKRQGECISEVVKWGRGVDLWGKSPDVPAAEGLKDALAIALTLDGDPVVMAALSPARSLVNDILLSERNHWKDQAEAHKDGVDIELDALNELGLRTRTHHVDESGGFVSILLDNAEVEIRTVDERDADRTRYNGKREVLITWWNEAIGSNDDPEQTYWFGGDPSNPKDHEYRRVPRADGDKCDRFVCIHCGAVAWHHTAARPCTRQMEATQ